jgi:hypothetical protein
MRAYINVLRSRRLRRRKECFDLICSAASKEPYDHKRDYPEEDKLE